MGVSGSGKSLVGKWLGKTTGFEFIDGDDLHPP
ncbi:MAG: shikimate kinase, partial [Mariniblastus sp.]